MSSTLRRFGFGFVSLTLAGFVACVASSGGLQLAQNQSPTKPTATNSSAATASVSATATGSDSSPVMVKPSKPKKPIDQDLARDGKIAQLVARILEQYHYNQTPFDNEVSQRMLKGYMDALDYSHLIFLQSDLDEFVGKFGNELDKYTVRADASPAFFIFDRFLQRLDQRMTFVDKVLKEKYDFTGNDRFTPNREKAPFPKDEAEAEQLWRSRVKFELLQGRLSNEKPDETIKRISKRYHNMRRYTQEMDENDVLQTYLNGLTHSYDPHTDYMTPEDAENFSINAIKLSLTGIGAVLRYDEGYAKIAELVPGGPADLCKKLKANDRIIGVAQGDGEFVDVVDMKLNKVVDLIRGKRGTKVRLLVIPAGQTDSSMRKEVVIIRDEIKLVNQLARADIVEHHLPNGTTIRVGVINLPQFYDQTVVHVARLIERLKKENVVGIILDLRRNGGGLLDQAIDLTGLFVKQGPVVQVRAGNGKITTLRDDDSAQLYSGPLIVLVGHLSASASEIVAGALQDYNRAVIVGDASTHGKGTVQTILPLERWVGFGFTGDPGNLKLTVQKFYRIAGGSTQKMGVVPDIQLPSLLDYMELGERTLPNCLPYDVVSKDTYDNYNLATPFLQDLIRLSTPRVEQSRDFGYVKQDIDVLKKRLADKSLSLNEEQRRKERSDIEAQNKARKQERAQRTVPRDKMLELTLSDVEKGKPYSELTLASVTAEKEKNKYKDLEKDKDSEVALDDDLTIDPHLDETVNIMIDYATLLGVKNPLANKEQ